MNRLATGPHGHRTAELRSLAFHKLVAERLDDEVLERAKRRVARWLAEDGPVHRYWAEQWRELLERPLSEIAELLIADTEWMRDMRQSTPFAGAVTEEERREIIQTVR